MINFDAMRKNSEKTTALREARKALTAAFLDVYSDHVVGSGFTDFKLIMSLEYDDVDSFEFECTPVRLVRGDKVRQKLRKRVDGIWR